MNLKRYLDSQQVIYDAFCKGRTTRYSFCASREAVNDHNDSSSGARPRPPPIAVLEESQNCMDVFSPRQQACRARRGQT